MVKTEIKKSQLSGQLRAQKARNWHLDFYKTVLINVIVLCCLFASVEFSYRVWLYFRNCDKAICYNTAFFTKLDAFNRYIDPRDKRVYRFLAPDPITGYSPADGTYVIQESGWNDATITIRQGVRVNTKFAPTSADGAILAVGDSFVFGDQVSDDETWPAMLEQGLNRRVVNGGVPGYGTAQSVLRAQHLLRAGPHSLVILSILVSADLTRDRLVDYNRPVVIREDGRLRQTTVDESRRVASENFVCVHSWIPELFFWSHIAKPFFSGLGYDGHCTNIIHPKAATDYEILEFAVEHLAALPVNKALLIQYPTISFEGASEGTSIHVARMIRVAANRGIDEARMIHDVANRHGVQVIDTYDALKNNPLREIYLYRDWPPHHSKRGNEVVADLIAREIAALAH